MNRAMNLHSQAGPPPQRAARCAAPLLVVVLALSVAGCKTSRQVSRSHIEESGFLNEYSQLQPGLKGQAALVYIAPNVDWKKYTKVKIDPVQLWRSDDPESPMGKIAPEDQQMLVDTFYDSIRDHLSKDYQIVDQAGPDTLVIRGAITEARKSRPVANLVSSVYLPLKAVSFGKRLITGTDIAVGKCTVEAEILDSQTNQRLAAAVDRRAGTKALRTKFNSTWGDVKLAFDAWAQQLQTRLAQERTGAPEKTEIGGSETP